MTARGVLAASALFGAVGLFTVWIGVGVALAANGGWASVAGGLMIAAPFVAEGRSWTK